MVETDCSTKMPVPFRKSPFPRYLTPPAFRMPKSRRSWRGSPANRAPLLVLPDTFTRLHRDAIVALAARYRLPAVYPFRYFAASGGLMSYGIEVEDLFRRSAGYVDRLLNGAKASDLPVQQPTKFTLVINLKTAKALGVIVPLVLLGGADEVIE